MKLKWRCLKLEACVTVQPMNIELLYIHILTIYTLYKQTSYYTVQKPKNIRMFVY